MRSFYFRFDNDWMYLVCHRQATEKASQVDSQAYKLTLAPSDTQADRRIGKLIDWELDRTNEQTGTEIHSNKINSYSPLYPVDCAHGNVR